jgi:hypothetical protein
MKLTMALALVLAASCATLTDPNKWEDPNVHALGLAVSPEVRVDQPELKSAAPALQAAMVKAVTRAGFRDAGVQGPDAVMRLTIAHRSSAVSVYAELIARTGEIVDERSIDTTPAALAGSQDDLYPLARALLHKLELAARVQVLARTGTLGAVH